MEVSGVVGENEEQSDQECLYAHPAVGQTCVTVVNGGS